MNDTARTWFFPKPKRKTTGLYTKKQQKEVGHIEINIHHDKKTVDIWLTQSESKDENVRTSLEPYYQQFGRKKYFVSVFESGKRDLFSDTILLLQHNLELQLPE